MVKIGSNLDEIRVDGRLDQVRRDLKVYEKMGLKAAEIPVHGVDAIRNGKLNEQVAKKTANLLSHYNLKYSVRAPDPLNLMDRENQDLHAEVFRSGLIFAETVGARIFVYHPGRFVSEEELLIGVSLPDEGQKRQLIEAEAFAIERLARDFKGITICLENLQPYLARSPCSYAEQISQLKQQVERIGRDNVRIALNTGHMYIASKYYGFDCAEATKDIAPLIAHTHVHDNFGRATSLRQKAQADLLPFGLGDSRMPVGWGEVPIAEILASYVDDYDGMFIMDLHNRYFGNVEESRDNLEYILTMLRRRTRKDKTQVKEDVRCSTT